MHASEESYRNRVGVTLHLEKGAFLRFRCTLCGFYDGLIFHSIWNKKRPKPVKGKCKILFIILNQIKFGLIIFFFQQISA